MESLEMLHMDTMTRAEYDPEDKVPNYMGFASKSAQTTKDIAIEFALWISKNNYIQFDIFENQMTQTHYKYQKWDKTYKNSFQIEEKETYTTEQLFDMFLRTKQ